MAKKSVRDNIKCWSVVAPALLYYSIFAIIPLFILIGNSMTDSFALTPGLAKFNGLTNFIDILTGAKFWGIMRNTIVMSVIIMVLNITIGFLIALLLTAGIKGKGIFRTIWYIPSLVSMAVISQMVSIVIRPTGLLNNMLRQLSILAPDDYKIWTESTFFMYMVIILLSVWRSLGGTVLLFMAGFTSIPGECIEAAKVDGAKPWQILIRIKMPLILPMFVFILINNIIGIFGLFEPIQLISQGGPNGMTNTIMYEIYSLAFIDFRQGYASSMSIIVLIITLCLTVISTKISKKSII